MEPKQEHKMISRADILLIVGIMILAIAGLFVWKKLQKPGAYVDILIDAHVFLHFHASELADLADIISSEIDKHVVFGSLFLVC